MLIPEIIGIRLNDILSNGFNNNIHFITHTLDQEIVCLPDDWTTEIYTSNFIYNIILSYRNNGPAKYFRKLKPGVNLITLKNSETLKIQFFVTSLISGNMMLAIEYKNIKILYSGVFSSFHQLLENDDFNKFVKSGINYLYIDNYYWRLESNEQSVDTIQNIKQIINLYPSSLFLVNVPILGYEDLILDIADKIGERVFISGLNLHLFRYLKMDKLFEQINKNANIIIGRTVKSLDEIEEDFQHKVINIRIIDAYKNCFQNNLEYHRYGLYEVKWSPHATRNQLEKLIELVKPKIIRYMYDILNIDECPIKIKNDKNEKRAEAEATNNSFLSDTIVIDDSGNTESILEISDSESSCRFILKSNSSPMDTPHSERVVDAELKTQDCLPIEDLSNDESNLVNLGSKLSQLNKSNKNTNNRYNKIDEVNKLNLSKDYKLLFNRAKRKSINSNGLPKESQQQGTSQNVSGFVDLVYKQPKFNFNVNDKEIIYLDSDNEGE